MMQLSQCTWTFPELLKTPAFLRRGIGNISSRSVSSSRYPSYMASASTVSAPNAESEQANKPPQPVQVIHLYEYLLPFLKICGGCALILDHVWPFHFVFPLIYG